MYFSTRSFVRMGAFFAIGLCRLSAQVSAPVQQQQSATITSVASSSTYQGLLQTYQAKQRALTQQLYALSAQGASHQQIEAWAKQHAAEMATQKERSQALYLMTGLELSRVIPKTPDPPGASQTLKDFLAARTILQNARARIHNQLVQQALASGTSPTLASLRQMRNQENQLFQQQNASALTLQQQRSQKIASESAAKLMPVPAVVVIPANVSPQMAAFMRTRNQIRRALAELQNQYAGADSATKLAAIKAWRLQNAALFAQMQKQTQNIVPSPSN